MHRIVIVGSGPAGLSAAAHAARLGVDHLLIEKTDHLSDTIYRYQKGKHVMAAPHQLPQRSDVGFEAGSRESILGVWDKAAVTEKMNVRYNAEVRAISGAQGAFKLKLSDGDTVEAEHVVLAIGTQGNPNLMRCPITDGAKVQYTLDDPAEYVNEHIFVIGGGDAGIENALGLVADPDQKNTVSIVNRSAEFANAKPANVRLLMAAEAEGRVNVLRNATTASIGTDNIKLDVSDGQIERRCDRVIARMGSAPPRKFVEQCGATKGDDGASAGGVTFTSEDRAAFPVLSPLLESTVPGIYVIGALAGYPLIKQCMNQGYDVVEFIAGDRRLKPADQPLLEKKLGNLPGTRNADGWLEFFKQRITIFQDLSLVQMRDLMLESDVKVLREGEMVFERGEPGTSMFAVASGAVGIQGGAGSHVTIGAGLIVGEVALVSGRPRGAGVRATRDSILIEIPRMVALKLMSTAPAAKRAVDRISIERQLLQLLGSGLSPGDLTDLLDTTEIVTVKAGEAVINEGDADRDLYVIRSGSMIVEKKIGGKPIFLSYLPAGSYIGEMALVDNAKRSATVRAAIKSQVVKLDGNHFAKLLAKRPRLAEKVAKDMEGRRDVNAFVEASKHSFSGAVDLYSSIAGFLVENGIGEATDVLLIDEKLCVGCDNCEKACADSHDGLSRLDREAGRTYAHLHVPTSCRHCEHPHCMADCPPNAIHRGADGEVFINDTCIGCGNCQRNCPYGVIRLDKKPPKKPGLLSWMFLGLGPGPGEPDPAWSYKHKKGDAPKLAVKCDMCAGIEGGPSCVKACPTGAAIRVAPEELLSLARATSGAA